MFFRDTHDKMDIYQGTTDETVSSQQ